jgi:hypothetical protein
VLGLVFASASVADENRSFIFVGGLHVFSSASEQADENS